MGNSLGHRTLKQILSFLYTNIALFSSSRIYQPFTLNCVQSFTNYDIRQLSHFAITGLSLYMYTTTPCISDRVRAIEISTENKSFLIPRQDQAPLFAWI